MEKLNQIINTIIGSFIGVFIGYGIYATWNFKTNPESYSSQSSPWYINILLFGLVTFIIILLCLLLKIILKYYSLKNNRPEE